MGAKDHLNLAQQPRPPFEVNGRGKKHALTIHVRVARLLKSLYFGMGIVLRLGCMDGPKGIPDAVNPSFGGNPLHLKSHHPPGIAAFGESEPLRMGVLTATHGKVR
jgi:hypothetical protein